MGRMEADKNNLKKFSITMFVALSAIGTILLLKHRAIYIWLYGLAALFLFLGIFATDLLRPIYIFWMRLAFALSWINTRLILVILFYLILVPIGLSLKLFGIALLSLKLDKNEDSYWISKEQKKHSTAAYERQF